MFIYRWEGLSDDGAYLRGELRAPSLAVATAYLLNFDIQLSKIYQKKFSFQVKRVLTSRMRIRFTEQLADLLSSGISMPRSLRSLEKAFAEIQIKTLIWFIRRQVESGQSFGDVLQLFAKEFNLAYRQLIKVGESSGQLDKVLIRLADLEKKKILLGNKMSKASFYPLLVLGFSLLITLFLMIGIVPRFVEIFAQAKLALPLATLLLINTANFLSSHLIIITLILLSGGIIYSYFFQTSLRVKTLTWQHILSFPWFGKIIKYFFLSRFSYSLSALLQVGISLTQAIEMLLPSISNPLYREAFGKLVHLIEEGNSLSQALSSSHLFPDFVVYTIKIGEEAGLVVQSLTKVANFYEAEIDRFVDGISVFLEPCLMIVLGVIISIFMVALYLPIFSLGNAV